MESRAALPLDALVDNFLAVTADEDPRLHDALVDLDENGRRGLAGVLGRFDPRGKGNLDAHGRLLASRVLSRLRKPSGAVFSVTNKILDYLDLNGNAILDEEEMDLCVQILEQFAHAEAGDNNTLSQRELNILYGVLRHLDRNDNHVLDPDERRDLRKALQDPDHFLADELANNPLLANYR